MSKRHRSNATTNRTSPFDYIDISSLNNVSLACIQGSASKLEALLNAGSSTADRDNQGRIPLHFAANKGSLDCCKLLLDHSDEEVNWQCYNGITPLMLATKSNSMDVVQYLLSRGALSNILDIEGSTCLNRAIDNKNNELFCYLLRNSDPNIGSFEGWTIAHTCAKMGNFRCLNMLANDERCKFAATEYGLKPLHLACQEGHIDCVRLLIESDKNSIECKANDGVTPLFLAAQNDHIEIVKYLLDKGSKVDVVTDNGTVLHSAVIGGNGEILQCLLVYGADVEGAIGHTEVDTPLNQAISVSDINLVTILLNHGADPLKCASDPYSSTPLRVTFTLLNLSDSINFEGMEILDLLLKHIPTTMIVEHITVELKLVIQQCDNFELMKHLIKQVGWEIIDWNFISLIISKSRIKCLSYLISSNFHFNELQLRIQLQDYFKESTAGHDHKHLMFRALYDQLQRVSNSFYCQILKVIDPITSNASKTTLLQTIKQQSATPRSLVDLCRFKIRHLFPSMDKFKEYIIDSLKITEQCKEILIFERSCSVSPSDLETCAIDEQYNIHDREWLVM